MFITLVLAQLAFQDPQGDADWQTQLKSAVYRCTERAPAEGAQTLDVLLAAIDTGALVERKPIYSSTVRRFDPATKQMQVVETKTLYSDEEVGFLVSGDQKSKIADVVRAELANIDVAKLPPCKFETLRRVIKQKTRVFPPNIRGMRWTAEGERIKLADLKLRLRYVANAPTIYVKDPEVIEQQLAAIVSMVSQGCLAGTDFAGDPIIQEVLAERMVGRFADLLTDSSAPVLKRPLSAEAFQKLLGDVESSMAGSGIHFQGESYESYAKLSETARWAYATKFSIALSRPNGTVLHAYWEPVKSDAALMALDRTGGINLAERDQVAADLKVLRDGLLAKVREQQLQMDERSRAQRQATLAAAQAYVEVIQEARQAQPAQQSSPAQQPKPTQPRSQVPQGAPNLQP